MKPTLLILAAGMGSRYGGLKQIDPIGPSNETIIDYSLYDAIKAGFGKVVFVIRESFEEEFKALFNPKLSDKIEVAYVTQEMIKVPDNFLFNPERTKPWGTGHAILMAKDVINEPFAVINADDFYGEDAFNTMVDFLSHSISDKENCMIGYRLSNTISETGSVSRGVCSSNESDNLSSIIERTQIEKVANDIAFRQDEKWNTLPAETIVSMNFWGFTPQVFGQLETQFSTFLQESGDQLKSEYFITTVIAEMMDKGISQFKILQTNAEWFGVTYKEDKDKAINSINKLIDEGSYPAKLWN